MMPILHRLEDRTGSVVDLRSGIVRSSGALMQGIEPTASSSGSHQELLAYMIQPPQLEATESDEIL